MYNDLCEAYLANNNMFCILKLAEVLSNTHIKVPRNKTHTINNNNC